MNINDELSKARAELAAKEAGNDSRESPLMGECS